MTKRISCKDTTWLVSESRERALTREEQQNLERHIERCPACQGASKQFDVLFSQLKHYLGNNNSKENAKD